MATAPPALPPLDLGAITEGLRGGRATPDWLASWLPATWQAPDAFSSLALAWLGRHRGAPCKSRPDQGTDLYHDLVAAHLGQRRTALFARAEDGTWQSVSYDALHARCSGLASAWNATAYEPGQVVAIALPPGLDAAVAILTAWRLGLVVAVVPPRGPTYVRRALARLAPDWLLAPPRLGRLGEVARLPLEPGRVGSLIASFSFPPGQPAARLVATHGLSALAPVDVDAWTLLDGAVRDSLLVYGLSPGQVLAAPGFDPLQHGLAHLAATLVAGASLALCSDDDVAAEPALLARLGVTVVGVRRELRDRMLAARSSLPPGARWFRSLTDLTEPARWDDFARQIPDRKQLGFSVIGSSASCGASLFSPPAAGAPTLRLWPAPGLSWQLEEVGGPGVPALNDAGVLAVLRGEQGDVSAPRAIVSSLDGAMVYGGSLDIGPDGRPYPDSDIEASVAGLPGVRDAAAFVTPGRWLNDARTVLLVFVEPEVPAATIAEVEAQVRREMGAALVPDRIEVLPLRPRRFDGQVDRAWCRSQYLSGLLGQKARSAIFRRLTRLGYLVADPARSRLDSPLSVRCFPCSRKAFAMAVLVSGGAVLQCSFGAAPSTLMVLPTSGVLGTPMPMASIMDNVPFLNVLPFAMCSSLANPAVAAATAAALGVLTPMPCTPVPAGPWLPGVPTTMVGAMPAVDMNCKLMCAFGGVIQVLAPGQFTAMGG